ncbi:sensor histidine kinase [Chitinolyticbacter meiyuanensis]|uniref:sensor histidine kinase n=1 Tax=Chitinolyticbacter meiyuanensis TaxID=682798 RepID=UPI0011E58CE1|nr:ATP-binding protein [Chitinolyticbacter meiyuanensis]
MWRPSIARRLFLILLLAYGTVWLGIYALGLYLMQHAISGQFDQDLVDLATAVQQVTARSTDPATLRTALAGSDALLAQYQRSGNVQPGFFGYTVRDAAGRLIAHYGPPRPAIGRDGFFDVAGEAAWRGYGLPAAQGRYRIEVSQSVASRRAQYHDVMLSPAALLLFAAGLPMLFLPAWIAVRSGLQPLRQLASELVQRPPDSTAPLAAPPVYAELVPLATSLDTALSRLAAQLQRERALLADAAHELRTPLAVVTTQADALIHAADEAAREAAIQRLRHGLARAARLVQQLLALARLDAGIATDTSRADLADLVRDTLAAHAAEAATRGIALSYRGPDQLPLAAPLQALESIVDNLVGNAVRHGRDGGTVEVTVTQPGRQIRLTVCDDGPGIPLAERERLFERFARGRCATASGSGLGLAIVASAARTLDASIIVNDGADGRGTAITVHWPSA